MTSIGKSATPRENESAEKVPNDAGIVKEVSHEGADLVVPGCGAGGLQPLHGRLYDLKAWIVYGCNLMQALPARQETVKAIQHLDFIVTVDVLPAEIAGWSDVVLPEATYLERDDDIANPAYQRPFLALRQEVVPPMYDSKPGWWIAKELAGRVGLADFFPWKDAREYVDARLKAGGFDVQKTRAAGVVLGKPVATCEEEGLPVQAATDSRKIELHSAQLAKLGFDPIPSYYPQEEGPPGTFRLLSGRAPTHTFGRTTNNRLLAEPYPNFETMKYGVALP